LIINRGYTLADTFLIDIDLQQLAINFTKADSKAWSAAEARGWLLEHDFTSVGGGWVCEDCQLDLLGKGEYQVIRQMV
jgi:hypothetical protein